MGSSSQQRGELGCGRVAQASSPVPYLLSPSLPLVNSAQGRGLLCTLWCTSCSSRSGSATGTILTGPFRSQGGPDLTCALSPGLSPLSRPSIYRYAPPQVHASCFGVRGQGLGGAGVSPRGGMGPGRGNPAGTTGQLGGPSHFYWGLYAKLISWQLLRLPGY